MSLILDLAAKHLVKDGSPLWALMRTTGDSGRGTASKGSLTYLLPSAKLSWISSLGAVSLPDKRGTNSESVKSQSCKIFLVLGQYRGCEKIGCLHVSSSTDSMARHVNYFGCGVDFTPRNVIPIMGGRSELLQGRNQRQVLSVPTHNGEVQAQNTSLYLSLQRSHHRLILPSKAEHQPKGMTVKPSVMQYGYWVLCLWKQKAWSNHPAPSENVTPSKVF